MSVEGGLTVELVRGGDTVIRSTRPLGAARVLEGKPVAEALALVPLLFSVCGTAQAWAASRACVIAGGQRVSPAVEAARELLVWLETAREHGLRTLLDWAAFLGEAPVAGAPAALNRLLPRARQAAFGDGPAFMPDAELKADKLALEQVVAELETLLATQVFGAHPAQWLEAMDNNLALEEWAGAGQTVAARLVRQVMAAGWSGLGASKVGLLPPLDDGQLETRLTAVDADAFIAAPTLDGECCETGPLARQQHQPLVAALSAEFGNGLLPRLAARLVELAAIPQRLREILPRLGHGDSGARQAQWSGVGLAQVEASRGRLVHRVEVADGVVRRYQIVAPTEWNFHPRGAVARGLATLDSGDEQQRRRQAQLLINAVDPCVGYELKVR